MYVRPSLPHTRVADRAQPLEQSKEEGESCRLFFFFRGMGGRDVGGWAASSVEEGRTAFFDEAKRAGTVLTPF
jgi:hypothetical protein